MTVRMRQFIERLIVTQLIDTALWSGYTITVDRNDDDGPALKRSSNREAILQEMFAVDDEYLYFHHESDTGTKSNSGWVRLVYGNDGWDVIADYSDNERTAAIVEATEPISEFWDNDGSWPEGADVKIPG